jgi:hypothetical protein
MTPHWNPGRFQELGGRRKRQSREMGRKVLGAPRVPARDDQRRRRRGDGAVRLRGATCSSRGVGSVSGRLWFCDVCGWPGLRGGARRYRRRRRGGGAGGGDGVNVKREEQGGVQRETSPLSLGPTRQGHDIVLLGDRFQLPAAADSDPLQSAAEAAAWVRRASGPRVQWELHSAHCSRLQRSVTRRRLGHAAHPYGPYRRMPIAASVRDSPLRQLPRVWPSRCLAPSLDLNFAVPIISFVKSLLCLHFIEVSVRACCERLRCSVWISKKREKCKNGTSEKHAWDEVSNEDRWFKGGFRLLSPELRAQCLNQVNFGGKWSSPKAPKVSRVLLRISYLLKFPSAKWSDSCIIQQYCCHYLSHLLTQPLYGSNCAHFWGFHSNCSKYVVFGCRSWQAEMFFLAVSVCTAWFEWLALQVAIIFKNWCGLHSSQLVASLFDILPLWCRVHIVWHANMLLVLI